MYLDIDSQSFLPLPKVWGTGL